jgi:hypothetical protein
MKLPLSIAVAVTLAAGPAAAEGFHPYQPKVYEAPSSKPKSVYGPKPPEPYKPHAAAAEPSQPPAFKPWKPSSTTSVFGPDKPKRAH